MALRDSILRARVLSGDGADEMHDYLHFTAVEAGSTVTYTPSTVSTAEYSWDKDTWQTMDNVTVTLPNVGDRIYVRGVISGAQSASNYAHFGGTGLCDVAGDISVLINKEFNVLSLPRNFLFIRLFYNSAFLHSADKLLLPALTLRYNDYCYMFYGQTKMLYGVRELPATKASTQPYGHMYDLCYSLVSAEKVLPLLNAEVQCYASMHHNNYNLEGDIEIMATTYSGSGGGVYPLQSMFVGCNKLNSITTHFTQWNNATFSNWVQNIYSQGTLYNLGGATIPRGNSGIPTNWIERTSK